MKKLVLVLGALSVTSSNASFMGWGSAKTDDVVFKTNAARQTYNDCMNGASGDASVTGCKSKRCRRDCKAIGDIIDKAKAEGIYPQLSHCAFGKNRRNDRGHWLDGCQIRKLVCFRRCESWAREKAQKNIPVKSRPFPEHPEHHQYMQKQGVPSSHSVCAQPWFSCRRH